VRAIRVLMADQHLTAKNGGNLLFIGDKLRHMAQGLMNRILLQIMARINDSIWILDGDRTELGLL
jgi:hypothetical protein